MCLHTFAAYEINIVSCLRSVQGCCSSRASKAQRRQGRSQTVNQAMERVSVPSHTHAVSSVRTPTSCFTLGFRRAENHPGAPGSLSTNVQLLQRGGAAAWNLQRPARVCDARMLHGRHIRLNIRSCAADAEYFIFCCNSNQNSGRKPEGVLRVLFSARLSQTHVYVCQSSDSGATLLRVELRRRTSSA